MLFQIVFLAANGPLAWSILAFNQSLVFHKWQQVLAWIKPVEGSVNSLLVLALLVGIAALGLRLWKRRSAGS